jgi:hypothetical protein
MTVLSSIRNRFSGRDASTESKSAGAPQGGPVAEAQLPFAGFDRLDETEAKDALSHHSQVELEAVESYERSQKNRLPVLDKLRFMRQREPLPGYDALSVKEIVAALKDADLATIKKVRGYERKFANRPDVLEEVARVHHARRAAQPASAAPGYEPISATSDRPEKTGRP